MICYRGKHGRTVCASLTLGAAVAVADFSDCNAPQRPSILDQLFPLAVTF